jgi:hypothetical protein
MTPSRKAPARNSMPPASLAKSSGATRGHRATFSKYPTLSQQVQQLARPAQVATLSHKFNPVEQSFKKLKGTRSAGGEKTANMFQMSGTESESEDDDSGSSEDERVIAINKSESAEDKPGCSIT